MARNDVRIRYAGGQNSIPTWTWEVAAGTPPTIKAGEPAKFNSSGQVILFADGEGTTTERFVGVAQADSKETAGAVGAVECYKPLLGLEYECAAKSSAAADTQSEINALRGKRVVWDLTSSTFTIDTAAGDGATNCVVITGGDPARSVIYFVYSPTGVVNE